MKFLYLLALYLTAVCASKNTLVLLDSLTTKETHSIFFTSLSGESVVQFTLIFRFGLRAQ